MTHSRYPYFTRMLCYVAGWYYKELKNEPPPAFCPKVLEDLPLLAQHLSNLAHKVADMNLTKDDRKKVMAEFPREYTNLKTLSLELKRLIEWHLEGRPPGKVGELFWEPGLDEMEFFDSSEDLSDHLPRDSDFESTSEENFEESEDEDFRIHAISSQKWEDEELPKSSKESMKPVVSASLKPKLKKIPAVIPKAAIKIQNEPTKEVPLPKFKVPAPKSTISVTQAVNIPPKRKDTTKAKLKSIMNGLKRSKHR